LRRPNRESRSAGGRSRAFGDQRGSVRYAVAPIGGDEVPTVDIEISVLTAPEHILPEAIVAGRHGLLVVRGPARGLLLPQVATERKWSGQRLLEETCIKAGLSRDAWRDPATEIFGFTAEVFSTERKGTISES